jgi:hypothetical protein
LTNRPKILQVGLNNQNLKHGWSLVWPKLFTAKKEKMIALYKYIRVVFNNLTSPHGSPNPSTQKNP